MAIETEVKFRMERDVWEQIKADTDAALPVDHVERQTNYYYNTAQNDLQAQRIGLRLRVLEEQDRSIVCVKRATKDAHKKIEIEETYDGHLAQLPPDSPALHNLLTELGRRYEDLVPLVTLRATRTVYHVQATGLEAEMCVDDVSILDGADEHKVYEVEFELVSGSEAKLMEIVGDFKRRYGDQVEQSAVTKLAYALQLIQAKDQ